MPQKSLWQDGQTYGIQEGREWRSLEKCRSLECILKFVLDAKVCVLPTENKPRFSASELCHLSPSAQAAPAWCQPPAPCKGHRALGSGAAMELLLEVQPQQSRVLTSVTPNKCVCSKGGCSGHSRGEGNVPAVTCSMGRDHPQQAGSAAGQGMP